MPRQLKPSASTATPASARHASRASTSGLEAQAPLAASTIARTVSASVDRYLKQLDGEPVDHLHELVMGTVERVLIADVLTRCGNNQSEAAAMLGINRNTLRSKIDKYQIELG